MEIQITNGTNTKSQRVMRIRIEISEHDLALVDGDPDVQIRTLTKSRNKPSVRLRALADLARAIEMGAKR